MELLGFILSYFMPTQADSGGLGFSLSRLLSVGVLLASSSRPSGVIYFVLAITWP